MVNNFLFANILYLFLIGFIMVSYFYKNGANKGEVVVEGDNEYDEYKNDDNNGEKYCCLFCELNNSLYFCNRNLHLLL